MAFTPLDPTKAEVRVTGEAPNQGLDFYIPRGAKGEPGGIVQGTVMGNTDLNSWITAGTYRQDNTAGIYGSTANNYPTSGFYGTVVIWGNGTDVWQEAHQQSYNPSADARKFYRRAKSNGAWSQWRAFNSTRVDQGAGRAIYQWDDVNNREQLIYGDTGLRRINPANPVTASGNMDFRRNGYTVEVAIDGVKFGANGQQTLAGLIPPGFRPAKSGITFVGRISVIPWTPRRVGISSNGDVTFSDVEAFATEQVVLTATYLTNDPWPTTLPGSAMGTIPNL